MIAKFEQWSKAIGLSLSADQLAAFEAFEARLYRANEVMNLTRVPREECWLRHFADSLLFQDLIPLGSRVLDVGTGPGFPAWPLACARPDLTVTAVDSNGKMLGFLKTQPLSNLIAIQARAEDLGLREEFDVVTGRAVAPLAIQLEISAAAARIGGLVLPMRTAGEQCADDRFGLLGLRLRSVTTRELAGSGVLRAYPIFEKVSRTPPPYPRRWPEIKAKPL